MADSANEPPTGTHCEWCGAEFEPGTSPPAPRPKAAAPSAPVRGEPLTHCEWCGAEYPVPGDED